MNSIIKEPLKFIWKREWVRPYESLWSIFRNFRIVNGYCSDKDGLKLLINDQTSSFDVLNSKIRTDLAIYTNINSTTVLYDMVKVLIPINYTKSIRPLSGLLNFEVKFLTQKLKYCPKCMENGYHSIFHQISGMKKCFIHDNPLIIDNKSSYVFGISKKYKWNRFLDSYSQLIARNLYHENDTTNLAVSNYLKLPFEWDSKIKYIIPDKLRYVDESILEIKAFSTMFFDRNIDFPFAGYMWLSTKELAAKRILHISRADYTDFCFADVCNDFIDALNISQNLINSTNNIKDIIDIIIKAFCVKLMRNVPLKKVILAEYEIRRSGGYDISDPIKRKMLFIRMISGIKNATDILDESYLDTDTFLPEIEERYYITSRNFLTYAFTGDRKYVISEMLKHQLKYCYGKYKKYINEDSKREFIHENHIASEMNVMPYSYVIEELKNGITNVYAFEPEYR